MLVAVGKGIMVGVTVNRGIETKEGIMWLDNWPFPVHAESTITRTNKISFFIPSTPSIIKRLCSTFVFTLSGVRSWCGTQSLEDKTPTPDDLFIPQFGRGSRKVPVNGLTVSVIEHSFHYIAQPFLATLRVDITLSFSAMGSQAALSGFKPRTGRPESCPNTTRRYVQ